MREAGEQGGRLEATALLSSTKQLTAGEARQNHLSRVISGLHKQLSTIIQPLPGASGQTDGTHKVGALWEVHPKAETKMLEKQNSRVKTSRESGTVEHALTLSTREAETGG